MDIGKLFLLIGANTSELDTKLKQSAQSIGQLGKTFTIAGAAVSAAIGLMIQKSVNLGSDLYEMSKRTGVSTEMLGAFKLAAEMSGTSLEMFATGMRKLSMTMVDVSKEGEQGKKALNVLGIEARNADGSFRPLAEVMYDVADKFKNMEDGALKNKIAIELFGRSGLNLIPMLNDGSEALRENYREAERLGMIMSKETAKGFDDVEDAQVKTKLALQGFGLTVTQTILPALKGMADLMTDVTVVFKDFAKTHPGLSSTLTTLAVGFGSVLTVTGGLLLIISKMKLAFTLLGSSAIGLAASLAIATAGVMALVYGLIRIKEEERQIRELQKELNKLNEEWAVYLDKAISMCNLDAEAIRRLHEKYKWNTLAMVEGITAGNDTIALQEALGRVVGEAAGKLEEQRIAREKATAAEEAAALQALLSGKAQKTLNEELGFMTRMEVAKEIEKIGKALTIYKDKLPYEEQKKLNDRLIELKALLPETYGRTPGYARDMSEVLAEATKKVELMAVAFKQVDIAAWRATGAFGAAGTGAHASLGPAVTKSIQTGWDDLFTNLTQGWANTIKTWFEGTLTFSDFIKKTWDDIKTAFFTVIAQMAAKWVVGFIGDLIKSASKAGSSIAEGVGGGMKALGTTVASVGTTIATILTTLATSLATVLTTLATAVGAALVAIATAIAAAATILAAAAVPIAIVLGLFIAAYALISAIGSLFSSGGKATDVTYWLKMMWADGKEVHDFLLGDFRNGYLNNFFNFLTNIETATRDTVNVLYAIKDFLGPMLGAMQSIDNQIFNLKGLQSEGFAMTPQLAKIGEVPEVVMHVDRYQRLVQNQNNPNMNVSFEPVVFSIGDKLEKLMIKFIPKATKNEWMMIHPNAVRPY